MCSLSEVDVAYNDTKRILNIFKLAKRSQSDLEKVRCSILHGDVRIPSRFRSLVMKMFKTPQVKEKLVGEEFNNWLKTFLVQVVQENKLPNILTANYNDILKFLENGKSVISHLENQLLNNLCIYGYFLEIFYQMYVIEHLSGRVPQTFKTIIQEKLNISSSYANRLRWMGKLWNDYRKIGQLAMSFNKFYKHKQEIDSFFNNCPLANEWKIMVNEQEFPKSNISTNPFINSTNPFMV